MFVTSYIITKACVFCTFNYNYSFISLVKEKGGMLIEEDFLWNEIVLGVCYFKII